MPHTKIIPNDGLQGLKDHFKTDALSGFIVFLLAMPLSLGIAKASDFPAVMGLVTAIIGGIVVSLFAGSRLTIKGPAAGLIVIVAGAVAEFGKGDSTLGWHLTLGAIVVAGAVQIIFGFLKLGNLSDKIPLSVIHGMLVAIGLIILSKQIHNLLGIDPKTLKGMEPLELIQLIPQSLINLDIKPTIIGIISLVLLFSFPMIKRPFIQKFPVALIIIVISILIEYEMDFKHTEPIFDLVSIGDLKSAIQWNVEFGGIHDYIVFAKYVTLFALIGSIESLLTVKAVDKMDKFHRQSDTNKDLIAVGIGNIITGIIGGLPMISEVARSSANARNGAITRWSNFFHGFWLLLFILLAQPIIEMIPISALAALLIGVGYNLAHPREFFLMSKKGNIELSVFLITIVLTLAVDLLVGVFSGIVVHLLVHKIFNIEPANFEHH